MKEEINRILQTHTHQSLENIQRDTDRDFFMSAQQSKEYGLIDEIIQAR
jgi:ATP-dependent Clp protease protease subunit